MDASPYRARFGSVAWVFGVILAVISCSAHSQETAPHWSYSGATGPEHWGSEDPSFALCGNGKRQSPIDIGDAAAGELPPIDFGYKPMSLTVTDTGHSIQVNAPAGSGGITVGGERYDLVQFHFHRPSEERIHGHAYSMVMHIVHKNANGELAVVAVLIEQGDTNAFLTPVFNHFPSSGTSEASVAGVTIDLHQLLPPKQGYYTFDGSLTTPPCSENVRWFVLKSPVQASPQQIQQFASRYAHDARPVQPLNDRKVTQTRD